WTALPDGAVTYCNQRCYEYTGSSPEQTLGDGWSQFLHPDDYEHTLLVWHQACDAGEPFKSEHRLKRGTPVAYRGILVRCWPSRDDAGQITKWFGTSTDIEEQKRIEHALRQSREELSVLMETVPQLVWIARPDGFLEQSNQRDVSYMNVPLEQFNG